ncbi:3-deoxy-D-manno-octulosonic acid kinase [Vibrio fluvialis]|nr:3-deoxy-D-manno-octulosonic acid kinase [Vibrio fluvialis]
MLKTLKLHNQIIWFDDELLAEDPTQCFDADFWQRQDKVLGSASGRGTTWFVNGHYCACALRHYHRGGLFGKLVKDHYWFSKWESTRSYQEFQLLIQLRQAGVNVPRPIAARAIKQTFCYQADLLSERIPNAQDLVNVLQKRSLTPEIYHNIGYEIRKMHDAQINHTDLNIHNILLDKQNKIWIIDFDKCFQQNGDSWKDSNILRLKRSFAKEREKKKIHYSSQNMSQLLVGYKSKHS